MLCDGVEEKAGDCYAKVYGTQNTSQAKQVVNNVASSPE